MRLQLTASAVLLLALPAIAQGQTRGDAIGASLRTSSYLDDDDTYINTSTLAVRGYPGDEVTLTGRYLVDVTTTASVDVVTAATDRWDEVRHEGQAGVAWADGTRVLSADYVISREPDWLSHTAIVGAAHDLDQHNLTVGLGGSFVHNSIGRSDDDNFARSSIVIGVSPSLVVVVDPRNILGLRYSFSYNDGYQASPYRYARFRDPDGRLIAAPESHPELRVRHAATVLWNHAFDDGALRSHLRAYVDDWGVVSATAGTGYVHAIDEVELGIDVRGYLQRAATFYEDEYAEQRNYMTADRELATFVDVFTTLSFGWSTATESFERIGFDVRLSGFAFFFDDFSELPRRLGLIAEAGFGAAL